MSDDPTQPDFDEEADDAIAADDADAPGECVEESDGAQHRRYTVGQKVKGRLDRYLRSRLPALSRSRLQKLINEGAVTVNGQAPKSSTIVRPGDVVDLLAPPPTIKQIPADEIPLDILYEDEHIIVVNKQADLVVHPARSNVRGTLVNALAWHYRDIHANVLEALSSVGVDEFRPGIIHRLDKDTTGAMVVAKTDTAHYRLGRQFERRTVQKYYLAIVHGEMQPPGGVIDEPIGKHPTVTEAYAVRRDGGGRDSVTLYRVREVFDGYSLVELELKTGRTHQIRVHLTYLGYPIVSDIIYGGEAVGEPELSTPPIAAGSKPLLSYARSKAEGVRLWDRLMARDDTIIRRPALHATVLQFRHPSTEEPMSFTAPLHPDMAALLSRLRRDRGKSGPLPAEGVGVDLDRVV